MSWRCFWPCLRVYRERGGNAMPGPGGNCDEAALPRSMEGKMKQSIVGSAQLRSGEVVCVTTQRTQSAVHVFDGSRWQQTAHWRGHELTSACACGDTVVCAALDDLVYLVRGTEVSELPLPKQGDWLYGAAALSDDTALLGGSGGLVLVSVAGRTATRRRLSEFNISRPGRDILAIVRIANRTLLLGKENLLVEYRGDSAEALVDRQALGTGRGCKRAAELAS